MLPGTAKITQWMVLWLAVWGIAFFQIVRPEPVVAPIPRDVWILGIFLVGIGAAYVCFPEERTVWLSKIDAVSGALAAIGALVLYAVHPSQPLGETLFVTIHVLFQQMLFAFLMFMKPAALGPMLLRAFVFFGLIHLLLIVFLSAWWTLFFTLFALPASIIFALCIERAKYGLGWNALLHLAFYMVLLQFL